MDPNEALTRARAHADAILNDEHADPAAECEPLAEAFQALDEWLGRGGFLPEAWARQADPLLDYRDAAKLAGIAPETWRAYVRQGYAPKPDVRAPVRQWRRSSVEHFRANRIGRGNRRAGS
ncbi:MAG: hypothetical protein M3N52_12020 [Actinomycetota bacterium]|nr:hypothetical protein [Actinomycetota bacterium]